MPCNAQLPIEARATRSRNRIASEGTVMCGGPPPAAASKEKLPERYAVQQAIGRGSYGSVWEALDRKSGRLVAVKKVTRLFRDPVDCKRILREIAIMSKLNHPNVIRLLDLPPVADVGSFDDLFIIMELCDCDMGKLVRSNVSLAQVHVQTLFYNMLVGLKYLHSAGIYHRDLKPANCLVNKDCSVKICDFGLACAVGELAPPSMDECQEDDESAPRLRRAMTNHVATRWYRAPELILLQNHYTEAVDVWSVGCIFAELLGMLEGVALEDRGPFFPGASCFPLSPDAAHATDFMFHTRENHDQLNVIFNILGTPCASDAAWIQREDAKRYLSCFKARGGQRFEDRFDHASKADIDILEATLHFNPQRRATVDGLLESEVFGEIREPWRETVAPGPIQLDFETGPALDELRFRSNFVKVIKNLRKTNSTSGGA